ncbi:MAG: hypothetical protein HYT77_05350 [Deltaproteobacteria bacterium]|nr:hypothetical protein [Deltaproteobacteria bacterium]
MAFAVSAVSLGLPCPPLADPATRPKGKNQSDAGATDRVLPPHPPNPIRGSKSKAATPSLVLVPSFVKCVAWVARRALRFTPVALAGRYYLKEPAAPDFGID